MAFEAPSIHLETADEGLPPVADRSLPIYATLNGRAVVIIPTEDYRELLALRMRMPRSSWLNARRKAKDAGSPPIGLSTIERDTEVAEWLRARFRGGITIAELHSGCLERFGPEWTPSSARIGKFRQRVRGVR